MGRLIDILPDSISALSKSVMWTVCMWVVAFVVLWFMCKVGEPWIAFGACACLVMVGVLPLVKGLYNTLHNIFGISACALSQLWVGLVGNWEFLIIWWVLYAISLVITKPKWCFVAEVWCIISIIFALCN